MAETGPDEPGLATAGADAPLRAPASLRAAVASIPRFARPTGQAALVSTAGERRTWRVGWAHLPTLAAAAMLIIAVGAGAVAISQANLADFETSRAERMERLTASMARLLGDPSHASTVLVGSDRSSFGTAVWAGNEMVVLATGLPRPPAGSEYRCWIQRDSTRDRIGVMRFGGGDIAYWWGDLESAAALLANGGGVIGISLEPQDGPGGSPPVLRGDLPV
jgi:hypothetical protein